MIIGICGRIGEGKSTVANYLATQYGFVELSFAESVKDVVAAIFQWDRELLNGTTPESRAWRETTDHWWASRLGIPNFTPRKALTTIGTDLLRTHFHPDIWVASLERKISKYTNVVVTDCRYPNEISMLKAAGAPVYCVVRKNPPVWAPLAVDAAKGNPAAIDTLTTEYGVHTSEWAWAATEFDAVLNNNSTLQALYGQIDTLITR